MSTPKFLTWSKGQSYSSKADRKHASSGVVPIPIEYISIKGLDYGRSDKRSTKMKRRPIPLDFDKPEHSNTNSFALHDAAIKSATTLMAVMNDVLKSPHLNAHFLSQHSGALQPVPGRSRSHTAPPTPLFEAPGVEPAELPGSFPVWAQSDDDARSSMDAGIPSKNSSVGRSIERPHSSPQYSSLVFNDEARQPALIASRSATNVRGMTSQIQHERCRSTSASGETIASGTQPIMPGYSSVSGPSTVNNEQSNPQSNTPRVDAAALDDKETIGSGPFVPPTNNTSQDEPTQRRDSKTLLDQMSAMRRSHEAHVFSLKEAHDREVESHRSYIQFLESCSGTISVAQESSKRGLTLDTSRVTGKTGELLSLDVSASTSLQSLDSSLEAQRRTSIESATAEAEALKRKLSLCRKTQSELGDVRRERDRFRESSDNCERRVGQLKDIVRKSKDAEKAMKNKVHSLEAALLAANTQRIDVLEGYHEACEQISGLHGKQLVMIQEREEAAARLASIKYDGREMSYDHGIQSNDAENDDPATKHETISHQVDDLQRLVTERDSRILELEKERMESVPKLEIRKLKARLTDSEAAREQYNALLHAELRRQSKIVALNVHPGTLQVENEAAATVAEKLKSKPGSENAEKRCEFLERELKHCVSEIILYKLDIRGYRKDLKEANAKVTNLQASRSKRPETPDSIETNKVDDRSATPHRRSRATSGLGISLQRSRTPTRPSSNRLSTPQHPSRAVASPSSSANTPLELDKRLPNPPTPSRDTSPNLVLAPPTTTLNRAETLRSLSESIISSYANRSTPEEVQGHMPPLFRGRSADAPRTCGLRPGSYRAIDAIAVPISKYTPDMLRTPNLGTTKGVVQA